MLDVNTMTMMDTDRIDDEILNKAVEVLKGFVDEPWPEDLETYTVKADKKTGKSLSLCCGKMLYQLLYQLLESVDGVTVGCPTMCLDETMPEVDCMSLTNLHDREPDAVITLKGGDYTEHSRPEGGWSSDSPLVSYTNFRSFRILCAKKDLDEYEDIESSLKIYLRDYGARDLAKSMIRSAVMFLKEKDESLDWKVFIHPVSLPRSDSFEVKVDLSKDKVVKDSAPCLDLCMNVPVVMYAFGWRKNNG